MNRLARSVAMTVMAALPLAVGPAPAATATPYKHVLLISIDGLHALDLANYVATNPTGALAGLARTGIFYPNAVTTSPSDSFPGFVAQVTGGTPKSTGVFYDDSFDRTYFAPGSDCKGAPGTEVSFAENVDFDTDRLDGGGTPGDFRSQIDPAKLPMMLSNGKCAVVYPHEFVRVNNIFEIVKAHGGRTAWSDKHPAYEWLNGPSGHGVDDFYALEQDSLIPGTKVKTTGSFKAEREFDEARVHVLVNEMRGRDSTGAQAAKVPELFGMNFQAVSVGQKLPKAGPGDTTGLIGGYVDATGKPNSGLAQQLDYVDGAVGELVSALKDNHLADSTLIVLASKHGQSPIDPATFQALDDDPYTKTPGYAFHIADDAALIWLGPQNRSKYLAAAQEYLEKSTKELGIAQIQTPNVLALSYQDPATDSRTPDFIITVNPGVVYTSGSKIAEHGGANPNDRSVALLVSNPLLQPRTVTALVQTTQVAPTILNALGLDANELQAVKLEGTQALPATPF
ncbi:alkaline phosphatase family protein [Inquilinus sp. NPDC058860]|uniref:alkaline phosphatase family protein n=1 Tax=Inquilinus sp. NPDC058860 TaxID=3346652 RepID=UPI0036AF83F7